MRILFLCLLITSGFKLEGQTTQVSLSANRVKAIIRSNGQLFNAGNKGGFVAPYTPGQIERSTLRGAGLWIGGQLASSGHLCVSITGTTESDFEPGIIQRDSIGNLNANTNFNKIWVIERDQIISHIKDWNDNHVIDHPIPSIFAWPGYQNKFFSAYNNGLELPKNYILAPFVDYGNTDFIYDPSQGDFPSYGNLGCSLAYTPDLVAWFSYQDLTSHKLSKGRPLGIEVHCQIWVFSCKENSPFGNTIYVRQEMINRGTDAIDSLYCANYVDFDIGNPNDDFIGCDIPTQMSFAYNGDPIDGGFYSRNPPAMLCALMRGPAHFDRYHSIMPIAINTTYADFIYYRWLNGDLPNGSKAPTLFPYPDKPQSGTGFSEVTKGNIPGERATLSAMGPYTFYPNVPYELISAYSFAQKENGSYLENLEPLYNIASVISEIFINCDAPFPTTSFCDARLLPVKTVVSDQPATIYPNPAQNSFQISGEQLSIIGWQLTDLKGSLLDKNECLTPQNNIVVPCHNLPAGVYFLEILFESGRRQLEKVVVLK